MIIDVPEDMISTTHGSRLTVTALQNLKEELTIEDDYDNWTKEFGVDGADLVRKTVEDSLEDYNYLKQFALKT